MNCVRVRYTVRPEFVETNKANIARVMADVRALNDDGVRYATFLLDDGVTFFHLGFYADDAAQAKQTGLDSFKQFQQALRGSGLVSPPQPEKLTLVASGYDLFG